MVKIFFLVLVALVHVNGTDYCVRCNHTGQGRDRKEVEVDCTEMQQTNVSDSFEDHPVFVVACKNPVDCVSTETNNSDEVCYRNLYRHENGSRWLYEADILPTTNNPKVTETCSNNFTWSSLSGNSALCYCRNNSCNRLVNLTITVVPGTTSDGSLSLPTVLSVSTPIINSSPDKSVSSLSTPTVSNVSQSASGEGM